ncbi:MAG: alanine dehydrogenase [Candidatus Omnitrophica bacterium]|nr:alanine dehydrogenase [Candidatus Omnitrophota bacterium]
MVVGVLRETKEYEYRVALVPAGVAALRRRGHTVVVQAGAGLGSEISDDAYAAAGAQLAAGAADVCRRAELLLKVKEPSPDEYPLIEPRHLLFTFFHFAANRALTDAMLARRAACVAYETVEDAKGQLPILIPMSEVAGRMAVQEGAKYLEKPTKGKGLLLGGVPGVTPATVAIIGAGVVGANAAKVAAGLGAMVTVLDIDLDRLRYLDDIMPKNVVSLVSNEHTISDALRHADLVICAALVRGARTPVLVTRAHLKGMRSGTVLVDVSIDQGGSAETSLPTTHSNPVYVEEGVVHYCVTNIPGAVPITSTYGLTNATLPYVLALADHGAREAFQRHPALARGLNILDGQIVYPALAETFKLPVTVPPGVPGN